MPTLDSCINSIFEPGNIGSTSGQPPTTVRIGTLYTPETYDPSAVTYSHDFSKFYNGFIQHHRVR